MSNNFDKFIEEAKAKKDDALILKKEMGNAFTPLVYELTYEQTYRCGSSIYCRML